MQLIWTEQNYRRNIELGSNVRGVFSDFKRPDEIWITHLDIRRFQRMEYVTRLRLMDWLRSTVLSALRKDGTIIIHFDGIAFKCKPHQTNS